MNLIEYYFEDQNPKFIQLSNISDLNTKVQLRFKMENGATEVLTFSDIILSEYLEVPIHTVDSRTKLLEEIKNRFTTKRADFLPFGDNAWELMTPIPTEWVSLANEMVSQMVANKTLTSFTLDTALASSTRIAYQKLLIDSVVSELIKQKSSVNAILQAIKEDPTVLLRRDIFNTELLMEVEETEDE